MTRTSLAFALVTLLAAATQSSAQETAPHHQAPAGSVAVEATQAADIVDAFHAALGDGDTSAALDLLAADVTIFEEGGAERSRDEYAAHHLVSDVGFAQATEARIDRRSGWAGSDIAWIVSEGRTSGQVNGRPVSRLTTETMVLRRSAEGWRIQHIHWSSRAPN